MRLVGPLVLVVCAACGRAADPESAEISSDATCRFTATTTLAEAAKVEGAAGYQVLPNGLRFQLEAAGFLAVFGSTAVTEPETGQYTVQVGSLVWRPSEGAGLRAQADTRGPDAALGSLRVRSVEDGLVRGEVKMELTSESGDPITVSAEFEALPGHVADTGSAFSTCLARIATPS
jgi:hypothetical protein